MKEFIIYAELSKKQYGEMEGSGVWFDLPDGVTLSRKKGSRACYFECDSKESEEAIIDILENKRINWQ